MPPLSAINVALYTYGVAVAGNYAYVADGFAGLQVIDVSNPANPLRVGGFDTSGSARGVAVSGVARQAKGGGVYLDVYGGGAGGIRGRHADRGGRCPPSPLRFIALDCTSRRVLGERTSGEARSALLLFADSSRRSGCVSAEPYPPLE